MAHCSRLHPPSTSPFGHAGSRSRLIAFGLLNLVLAWPRSSVAETALSAGDSQPAPSKELVQEAGEHYRRGLNLYTDGEHALAAIEFDRAYALVADFRVLFNIGQVRIQLNHYAKARRALERYLGEGGKRIGSERRERVHRDLEMLSLRTGTLRVETNVVGAEISVDGERVGASPLSGPLLLDAGDHRVAARKVGFSPADSELTLVGGDATNTRLDLAAEKPSSSQRIIVERHIDQKSDRASWIWGTWSATGVLAVSGAVVGGLGLQTANDLDRLRADPNATRGQLDSTQRRARTLLVLGDVLGGAAIVSGGVALFLTLTNRPDPEATPTPLPPRSHVDVALGPRWLGLQGAF